MSKLNKIQIEKLRNLGFNIGSTYIYRDFNMLTSAGVRNLVGYCKLSKIYGVIFVSIDQFGGHTANLGDEFSGHCWYTEMHKLEKIKNINNVGW